MLNPFIDKDQKENLAHNEELKNNIQNPCEPLNYDLNNNVQNIIDSYHSKSIMENRNINRYEEKDINMDNYDSDIDDPRYRPNSDLIKSQIKNEIIIDENNKNNYFQNDFQSQNDIQNNNINFKQENIPLNSFRFHNYECFNIINNNQENIYHQKSILELENENDLLKQELFKREKIIKNKDETICEFQDLLTTFKTKFEQYEAKNNILKQKILFLEQQLNNKNNEFLEPDKKEKKIENKEDEKNISFYKKYINDLETNYEAKAKKLSEKFKEKEINFKNQKEEEILKLKKDLDEKKIENEKLKSEISSC